MLCSTLALANHLSRVHLRITCPQLFGLTACSSWLHQLVSLGGCSSGFICACASKEGAKQALHGQWLCSGLLRSYTDPDYVGPDQAFQLRQNSATEQQCS